MTITTRVFAAFLCLLMALPAQARYYDAATGRFLSADTIVPAPADPQSLNRYAYVRNNPLKYTDPTGHSWVSKAVGEFNKSFLQNAMLLQTVDVFSGSAALASRPAGRAVLAGQAMTAGSFGLGAGLGLGGAMGWGAGIDATLSYSAAKAADGNLLSAVMVGAARGAAMSAAFAGIDRSANLFTAMIAKGTISGAVADMQGGDFMTAFKMQGAATVASWTFSRLVGYGADPTPGTELSSPDRFYDTERPPFGKNVIGFNGGYPKDLGAQGGIASRVGNAIPGGNNVAQFHDSLLLRFPGLDPQPWNALTIIPSIPFSYAAQLGGAVQPFCDLIFRGIPRWPLIKGHPLF